MEPVPQESEDTLCSATCGEAAPAAADRSFRWRSCGTTVVAGLVLLNLVYLFSEGLAISCNAVVARIADQDEKVTDPERYFGISPKDGVTIRDVAVAEGTFTKDTWLSAWLYAVKAGSVEKQNGFTLGRSPSRIGEAIWINMKITLALGEYHRLGGRRVLLAARGFTRGSGTSGDGDGPLYDFPTRTKKVLPGRLWAGRKYILYVEGDRDCTVTREMSLEEFAAQNNGNYFVIVVELR
jgi:hypothetical protein